MAEKRNLQSATVAKKKRFGPLDGEPGIHAHTAPARRKQGSKRLIQIGNDWCLSNIFKWYTVPPIHPS